MARTMNRINRHNDRLKTFTSFPRSKKAVIVLLAVLIIGISIFLSIMIKSHYMPVVKLSREYKVGELSDENAYSPANISYIDDVATQRLYREAENSVLPQFAYSISSSMATRNRIEDFEEVLSSPAPRFDGFLSKHGLVDDKDVMKRISSLDKINASLVTRLISECVIRILEDGLFLDSDIERVEDNGFEMIEIEKVQSDYSIKKDNATLSSVMTKEDIPSYVLKWLSELYPSMKSSNMDLISDGVMLIAEENTFYDATLTDALKLKARESVEPVLIEVKKGDQILSVDRIVSEKDLKTISELNSKSAINVDPLEIISKAVYLSVIVFLFIFLLFGSLQYKYRVFSYTTIILSLTIVVIVASYFIVGRMVTYGIDKIDAFLPFLILPMIVSAIANNKIIGFASAVFYASIQNIWQTSNIYTFFYIITISMICLLFLNFDSERIKVITQCIISSACIALVTILFTVLEDMSLLDALISILGSAAMSIIANILMAIILPILERAFNIPTGYRLHELSYADTPTLNRLNQVALGTYNHSKNVSDMAYNAAKAVGANAELARVGGLYHDIGKSEHPEYFVENQIGKNAHDDISSTLSAAVIKSHVRLGVEKAKEIGLPQEVIDIIGEHHGNDLIKYFYNEAVKNNKYSSAVAEEDFRYNGNIPSTPESAIVMLSDCVEAATRTIKNPNRQKYDRFISNIVVDKINHNQLNDSRLTITDLNLIKESFIHQLMGRDHHRIEYDNDK